MRASDVKTLFNLSALVPGSAFVFLSPIVESGRRGEIRGTVLGPTTNGGIAIQVGPSSDGQIDEWSGRTYVMPLTTMAVQPGGRYAGPRMHV